MFDQLWSKLRANPRCKVVAVRKPGITTVPPESTVCTWTVSAYVAPHAHENAKWNDVTKMIDFREHSWINGLGPPGKIFNYKCRYVL